MEHTPIHNHLLTLFDIPDEQVNRPRLEGDTPAPCPAPPHAGSLCVNVGPKAGPVRARDVDHAVGVVAAPGSPWPVLGVAFPTALIPDRRGAIRVFRLDVPGVDPDDRWIVVDRVFVKLGESAEFW